jgi:hypothetical protein
LNGGEKQRVASLSLCDDQPSQFTSGEMNQLVLVLFNSTSDIMLKSINGQPLGVVKLDILPLNAVAYQLFQLPSIHHWLKPASDIHTYF